MGYLNVHIPHCSILGRELGHGGKACLLKEPGNKVAHTARTRTRFKFAPLVQGLIAIQDPAELAVKPFADAPS